MLSLRSLCSAYFSFFFFFNDTATTEIYTLSLHDALPISSDVRLARPMKIAVDCGNGVAGATAGELYRRLGCEVLEIYRSEEHTSELQSLRHLVCRLLLEKKKKADRMSSEFVSHRLIW